MMKRRDFLAYSAALSFVGLASAAARAAEAAADDLAKKAVAAGQTEVVMGGSTGAYADRVKAIFLDPFTAATGIKVISVGGSYGEKLAKLKAMTAVGNVEWDMMSLSVDSLTVANRVYFEDLGETCQVTPNVAKDGIPGACLRYGAIFDIGAGVLAYDESALPAGQRPPGDWADFWDVKTFPGPRALPDTGTPWWNLIAALTADGVAPKDLFPLDLDRAFKKLDEIKPHVTVWWQSGDQSQQIFRSKEVVMAMLFAGRAKALQAEKLPIGISWKNAPLDASFWGVLKDAKRPLAAQALLNFIYSRPEAHAQYITQSQSATSLKTAIDLLDPAVAKELPTYPSTWATIIKTDGDWLSANQDAVLQRWSAWLAS